MSADKYSVKSKAKPSNQAIKHRNVRPVSASVDGSLNSKILLNKK